MYSLCLSLGHNSSAVIVEDGNIICGYENERLTGVKADSRFPTEAIQEIGKFYDLNEVKEVYISHWSTFGTVDEMSYKHWQRDTLLKLCPKINELFEGNKRIYGADHHDCHVSALRAFCDEPFEYEIVADGFGNYNETISIYKNQELIHRVFGFEKSLGLLYQYTTAYLDLKMNQDEYKLLGYESNITRVLLPDYVEYLTHLSAKYANTFSKRIFKPSITPKYDLVAGLEALPNLRLKIKKDLDRLLGDVKKQAKFRSLSDYQKKTICAYFIQSVVEKVMVDIILVYRIKNVALTGGLFMNVKLNNIIAKYVNSITILPICGDQSGGLGCYNYFKKDLVWPNHLFWGKRDLSFIPKDIKRMHVFEDEVKAYEKVHELIGNDGIVNIVKGNMEFGARALGNTSTITKPLPNNVRYINMLNNRSSIMPMAGMISTEELYYYKRINVYKSLEYMIITLNHLYTPMYETIGCHHKHPTLNDWTNRVQLVLNDNLYLKLIKDYGMLINTSFNTHGQPIVYSTDQIINAHNFQLKRDSDERMHTVIIREK